jgi:hypothetical protein
VATATLALVGAVLTIAQPAHAEPSPVIDSFENDAPSRWSATRCSNGRATIITSSWPVTGTRVAALDDWVPQGGRVGIYRTVQVDIGSGPGSCWPTVWLRKMEPGAGEIVNVTLEMRLGGIDGDIISPTKLVKPKAWAKHAFTPFGWRQGPMTVVISTTRGHVEVDELIVHCVADPR